MKNSRDSRSEDIIDEHAYCPNCQYEFTARLPLSSKIKNLVQTSCPRCKLPFKLDIADINIKRPRKKSERNLKKQIKEEKLYCWPKKVDIIDDKKLLLSFYGYSNVSSPLMISDFNGEPSLLQNEKTLLQANKITATINIFKKPMRRTINKITRPNSTTLGFVDTGRRQPA